MADDIAQSGAPAALPGARVDELAAVPPSDEALDWSWPPYAPPPPADVPRFDMDVWAPSSTVRRPLVRLGRWTLLYRRAD